MAMNPGMKMMLMQRNGDRRSNRSEYGGDSERRMIGYDRDYATENRRYAEQNSMENRMRYDALDYEPIESRRRRDSRGRFMESEGWEGNRGYPRSNYEPEARRRRDSRGR